MAEIAKTDIGTTRPVQLCDGKPMIPSMGKVSAGLDGQKTMFKSNWTLLGFQFILDFNFKYFFGLCGPAWGACMYVEGNTSGKNVSLAVSGDEVGAGVINGTMIGLGFAGSIKYYSCWVSKWHWWGPEFACGWNTSNDVNVNIPLDPIKLAIKGYELITGKKPPVQESSEPLPITSNAFSNVQAHGVNDFKSGKFAENGGMLKANPHFAIPINIWNIAVNMDESAAAFSGSAVALNEAMKAMSIKLEFGPSFGLAFPVTVQMSEIYLNGVKYDNLSFSNGIISGTTTGTPPSSITDINVKVSQTTGLDFYFGIFGTISWKEVIKIGGEIGFNMLKTMFGINPETGPFSYDFPNTTGASLAKACGTCGTNTGLYEVVFE